MKNTEPPLRDRHILGESIIRVSEPDGRSDSSWFNPWCFSNALVIPGTSQKWMSDHFLSHPLLMENNLNFKQISSLYI